MPPAWEKLNGVAPKEKFLKQISMENTAEILDALILMTNSDTFLDQLHEAEFEQVLGILKTPAFGETRMKVDVLAG